MINIQLKVEKNLKYLAITVKLLRQTDVEFFLIQTENFFFLRRSKTVDSNEITISISSLPDRDFLVAEIFIENEQIAEINRENEKYEIEIYPRKSGAFWKVGYEDLISNLQEAKETLSSRFS